MEHANGGFQRGVIQIGVAQIRRHDQTFVGHTRSDNCRCRSQIADQRHLPREQLARGSVVVNAASVHKYLFDARQLIQRISPHTLSSIGTAPAKYRQPPGSQRSLHGLAGCLLQGLIDSGKACPPRNAPQVDIEHCFGFGAHEGIGHRADHSRPPCGHRRQYRDGSYRSRFNRRLYDDGSPALNRRSGQPQLSRNRRDGRVHEGADVHRHRPLLSMIINRRSLNRHNTAKPLLTSKNKRAQCTPEGLT